MGVALVRRLVRRLTQAAECREMYLSRCDSETGAGFSMGELTPDASMAERRKPTGVDN